MSELFFTFDYIAVHLRSNIKKEDNNISKAIPSEPPKPLTHCYVGTVSER